MTEINILKNLEPKYLRKGGRKAPAISKEQLLELILAACPDRYKEGELNGAQSYEQKVRIIEDVFYEVFEQVYDLELDEIKELFGAFAKPVGDWKIKTFVENFYVKDIKIGKNGVPYLWVMAGGDSENPVSGMIYWDGKDIRAYIPTYGNPYNRKQKAAYGEDDLYVISEKFETMGKRFPFPLEADEEACDEDFSSRVICTGKISDEDLKRGIVRNKKLAAQCID